MKASSSALLAFRPRSSWTSILIPVVTVALVVTTGCGSGSSKPTTSQFSGNTSVTVVVSNTANDQATMFDLEFQTWTLTVQ
jgi:hypothetical protein